MPFSYSRSIALWWRFGREAGYGVSLLYVVKMPHANVQLLASLLQRLFNIRVYNRHRSIHHAISFHENDKKIVEHARAKMKEILGAAGGEELWTAERTAHILGTCRMGTDAKNSVVNRDCRSHDISNLFVCDGSVFPTSTAVNPSLTIQAIAARTADRIADLAQTGDVKIG